MAAAIAACVTISGHFLVRYASTSAADSGDSRHGLALYDAPRAGGFHPHSGHLPAAPGVLPGPPGTDSLTVMYRPGRCLSDRLFTVKSGKQTEVSW